MSEEIIPIVVLSGSFFSLLLLGIPISFSIGMATLLTLCVSLPFWDAAFVIAPRLVNGLQSLGLLAIPFFILAGNIMNQGGIAKRLVNLARLLVGWLPGALAHINVVANMMFGALSGSGVAAAAAVGGIMHPQEEREGYDKAFSAAVNISSCSTGLLIPPSGALIIYSLSAGGVSIAALFLAGYIPGLIMGLAVMVVATVVAMRKGYKPIPFPPAREAVQIVLEAIPALILVIVIMGGIIIGAYTPTEASGVAVALSLLVAFLYREIKLSDLPRIILQSVLTTSIVLFLVATSKAMAFVIANADIPFMVEDFFANVSDNPIVVLIIINVMLLIVGFFMDMTPAVLIFTPILLPVVTGLGMDPVMFGIVLIFNLSIGLCTPPVGSALFVGCSVAGTSIERVFGPLLPFFLALIAALMLVTFVPALSLWLPSIML